MGQRYSLLHFLSREQQLDVYRTKTRLDCGNRTQQRPSFEIMPPEIRAIIFEYCIREHEATSADRRRLREAAQYVITTRYLRSWVKGQPRYNTFSLKLSYTRGTIRWLVEWLLCSALDVFLRYLFSTVEFARAVALLILTTTSNERKWPTFPRTTVWHETLAIWVLLKEIAMLPWHALAFLRFWKLLLWYFYVAHSIDYVDVNHHADFDRILENQPSPNIVHTFQDRQAQVYDLPIFFLNRGLREEALKAANILGHRWPPSRPRQLLTNTPELLDIDDEECRISWAQLIAIDRETWCELMDVREYTGTPVETRASASDDEKCFGALSRPAFPISDQQ